MDNAQIINNGSIIAITMLTDNYLTYQFMLINNNWENILYHNSYANPTTRMLYLQS
jgi:hypothetical protein